MTARTPGPWYLDADFNVCQDSMQLEPMEIVASYENLTAENAAMRKALEGVLSYDAAVKDQYKLSPALIAHVRAALAQGK